MRKILNEIKRANPNLSKKTKVIYIIIILIVILYIMNKLYTNSHMLLMIPILVMSVVLHELAHGFVAYINGDDTAKSKGRLSLNPVKHIDIFGLLLPIFLILVGSTFIIGWAKPVPISYYKLKNQTFSVFFVSIAGIVTNIVLAITGALFFRFLPTSFLSNQYIYLLLVYLIKLNITLAIFNLLPIPPLDGSKIITAFGSNELKMAMYNLEKYGFLIIMILIWTRALNIFMNPLYKLFYNMIQLIIG